MTAKRTQTTLRGLGNPKIAAHSQRFYKTGSGEYGEDDRFLGIRVPVLRAHVGQFESTSLAQVRQLLNSVFHEERFFALLLLIRQFRLSDDAGQTVIYQLYLNSTVRVNNWDLVDCSAAQIVGAYLRDRDRTILYRLADSQSRWLGAS